MFTAKSARCATHAERCAAGTIALAVQKNGARWSTAAGADQCKLRSGADEYEAVQNGADECEVVVHWCKGVQNSAKLVQSSAKW